MAPNKRQHGGNCAIFSPNRMGKRRSLSFILMLITLVHGFSPLNCNRATLFHFLVDAASAGPAVLWGKVSPSALNGDRNGENVGSGIDESKVNPSKLSSDSERLRSNDESRRLDVLDILAKAGKRALGGGVPGALAGVVQVLTMMWLRTVVIYQCRYGATFNQALSALHGDGGIPRFYRGISFALIQAPLSRFGSTAANDGTEALVSSLPATRNWGPGRTTFVASLVVGLWRALLVPIDTCKTVLQVDSITGFQSLTQKVSNGQIGVLYQGAYAIALSAIVAHYPWFFTYNMLAKSALLKSFIPSNVLRNSCIGFASSVVSDTVTNPLKVVKTTKQVVSAKRALGYAETVQMIVSQDGLVGLFTRGLKTRVLANALQSIIFTVIWRGLAEEWDSNINSGETQQSDLLEKKT